MNEINATYEDSSITTGLYAVANPQPVQSYWTPVLIGMAALLILSLALSKR